MVIFNNTNDCLLLIKSFDHEGWAVGVVGGTQQKIWAKAVNLLLPFVSMTKCKYYLAETN